MTTPNYLNIIGNMGQRITPGLMNGITSLTDVNQQYGVDNRSLLNAIASTGNGQSGDLGSTLTDIGNNASKWSQMNKILGSNFTPDISSDTLDPRLSQSFLQGIDQSATNPQLGVGNIKALNAMANLGFGAQGTPDSALSSIGGNSSMLAQMNKILGTSYMPPPSVATPTPTPSGTGTPTPTQSPIQIVGVQRDANGGVAGYVLPGGSVISAATDPTGYSYINSQAANSGTDLSAGGWNGNLSIDPSKINKDFAGSAIYSNALGSGLSGTDALNLKNKFLGI